jgi:CBS domain-containing protein
VKDIMTKKVYTASPNDPIEAATLLMGQRDIGSLPVIDKDRKVLGIITAEDIIRLKRK